MALNVLSEEKLVDCPSLRERVHTLRVGAKVVADPRVSVIIPAYQISEFVAETLGSVFDQTYCSFEVIVVNDGSADTAELERQIEPFAERIVYAAQPNLGASQARNTACSLARGEWLAFLDGDDVWLPGHLESQVDFAEREGLDMAYCDALMFGEKLFEGDSFMRSSPSNGEVTCASLISADCNVITSGTILKRELYARAGGFDPDLRRMQDFDLWYRVARAGGRIGYQKQILIKYRVRIDSLSGSNVDRSWRNIRALNVIAEKYDLNASEKLAWDAKMLEYKAEYELEKGKYFLISGEFGEARKHIERANEYFKRPKLTIISNLIRISPRLARLLFRKFRSGEYSFIELHR